MWLTLHYPTLITPLLTQGGPAEADGSKPLVHVAASIFRSLLNSVTWALGDLQLSMASLNRLLGCVQAQQGRLVTSLQSQKQLQLRREVIRSHRKLLLRCLWLAY